jgi:hypothetical protein
VKIIGQLLLWKPSSIVGPLASVPPGQLFSEYGDIKPAVTEKAFVACHTP